VRFALTRAVSPAIGDCELTHLPRAEISYERACAQHRAYQLLLADLDCELIVLPVEPDLPDSVFVEDTALVLDEIAVILRPGAASRQPETPSIACALADYRELAVLGGPGTLDGGDILRLGTSVFVGRSGRSNETGIRQLTSVLAPLGYRVVQVPVSACLHLKSAVTQVGPDTLLIDRWCVDPAHFGAVRFVEVDPGEPLAANALLVDDTVVYPASHPRTLERLVAQGLTVRTVDVSELEKAEGAVTCCSILFEAEGAA
jgi:dimethylargininase